MRSAIILIAAAIASSHASAFPVWSALRGGSGAGSLAATKDIGTIGCVYTAPDTIDCPSGATYVLKLENTGAGIAALHINGNLAWHAGNDSTGSQLDADFLDTLSAAAFCQVAGGADCVLTSYRLAAAATAQLNGNSFTFRDSAGGDDLVVGVLTGVTGFGFLASSDTSGSAIFLSTNAGATSVGQRQNQSAGALVTQIADGMDVTTGSVNQLIGFYGSGAQGVIAQQAITIADDGAGTSPTDTTAPTSSRVEVTCNDANGCNYTPGEGGVVDGWDIRVCNISAANTVTITESAGTIRVRDSAGDTATTIILQTMTCSQCSYTGTEWGCF